MITNSTLYQLKDIVQNKFTFEDNPFDIMWLSEDDEPIDYCDSFWKDPYILNVKFGCSKVVLFFTYLDDYVLKIPFIGKKYIDGACHEFTGCNRVHKWDYCRTEESIYDLACSEGIGDLFCGTRFLCRIQNYPIYISEKSDDALDEDVKLHQSSVAGLDYIDSKRKESGKTFWYAPGDMDNNTIGMFYDSWGKELTDKLLDFLVDNNIQDCHNGNVAFRDNKIRLIDYSGFYR